MMSSACIAFWNVYFIVFVCVSIYKQMPMKVIIVFLDPLELELQVVVSHEFTYWQLSYSSVQERQILFNYSSLQPCLLISNQDK